MRSSPLELSCSVIPGVSRGPGMRASGIAGLGSAPVCLAEDSGSFHSTSVLGGTPLPPGGEEKALSRLLWSGCSQHGHVIRGLRCRPTGHRDVFPDPMAFLGNAHVPGYRAECAESLRISEEARACHSGVGVGVSTWD